MMWFLTSFGVGVVVYDLASTLLGVIGPLVAFWAATAASIVTFILIPMLIDPNTKDNWAKFFLWPF